MEVHRRKKRNIYRKRNTNPKVDHFAFNKSSYVFHSLNKVQYYSSISKYNCGNRDEKRPNYKENI